METLDELAIKHETDKSSKGHNYTPMYEFFMERKRQDPVSLLEIGFGNGASAKMWRDYFPRGELAFIELFGDESKGKWGNPGTQGFNVLKGNQADQVMWDQISSDSFDFVVEDGSHYPLDSMQAFQAGFGKVKPGGFWFIEDTHCNFHEDYSDSDLLYPWAARLVRNLQVPEKCAMGGDFYQVREFIHGYWGQWIYAIHHYHSVIVIEKAK